MLTFGEQQAEVSTYAAIQGPICMVQVLPLTPLKRSRPLIGMAQRGELLYVEGYLTTTQLKRHGLVAYPITETTHQSSEITTELPYGMVKTQSFYMDIS